MKKKRSRELATFLILIAMFLWTALYITDIRGDGQPAYSVMNRSANGYSVFYDALKEMSYSVDRSLKPLGDHEYSQVQIVAEAPAFNISSDEGVKNWISSGGMIVYLSQEPPVIDYASRLPSEGSVGRYQYGNGFILVMAPEVLLNSTLTEDYTIAYQLLQAIEEHEYSSLYFNEYYMYLLDETPSLWEYIPIAYRLLFYQLLIALAVYFYYRGKGFGRPIPLYEESERIENEYIHTASALYIQGSCWDIILESYYRSLLRLLRISTRELLEAWETKGLPEINKVKGLQALMERPNSRLKAKEYIEAILLIEELKSLARKGREIHWKILKKQQ